MKHNVRASPVRARVRCTTRGILLKPMAADIDTWCRELDRFSGIPFMVEGRHQPLMPRAKKTFALTRGG